MDTIYVMEPGSYVRREGQTLNVVLEGKVIDRIPAQGLKRLILVGRINLTGAVLDFLIRQQVETVFMTYTGRFRGRLGVDDHRHVALRQAQYKQLGDSELAAGMARKIVAAKIRNMIRMLLLRGRQYGDESLRTAAAALRSLAARLETIADMDKIRGVEGAATRAYFRCFGRLIRNEEFVFNGRSRRPPLDPVNALLSFVYTLLTNEVLSVIKAVGLDPYLGALHEISYGRPSLACDLVEEYRVFLGDRLVLGLINRNAISPGDFIIRAPTAAAYADEEQMQALRPVEIRPPVRRTFVAAYEQMMNRTLSVGPEKETMTYRRLLLRQARAFADHLLDPKQPYEPFVGDI